MTLTIFTNVLTLVTIENRYFDMETQGKETNPDELVNNEELQPSLDDSNSESIDPLKEMQDKIDQLQDRLLRQLAENENMRVRNTKLIEEAREYDIFGFCKDLVAVMDNLSRALEHLPDNPDDNTKNIIEGIGMTQKELENAFKKHSLELIEPQSGDKFDYHYHHAISQIMTDQQEAGTIVHTMQAGYKIKDRLIRPASVAVAKKLES